MAVRALPAILAIVLVGCAANAQTGTAPTVAPETRPDGPMGDFHGVLVQGTEPFTTTFANDSIPAYNAQRYDTDGAWSPDQPDRIVIPEAWDEKPVIFTARGAWKGHDDDYIEVKLYCGAERPIGDEQEERLVSVVQQATNIASPFVELTTPPLVMDAGTECFVAYKTPAERTLIPYGNATTLFGAYLP